MTAPRLGVRAAVAVFAAGALTLIAAPAYAAGPADLELTAQDITIAANSSGKIAQVTVTNYGPGQPDDLTVTFDLTNLDTTKVDFGDVASFACDDSEPGKVVCPLLNRAQTAPPPDTSENVDFPLVRKAGASGSAGTLAITLTAPEDTTPNNNAATVDVSVDDSGPDLRMIALNVGAGAGLVPGGTDSLVYAVKNFGDQVAAGLKITAVLPEDTTFTETEPDCVYSADRRTINCTYPDLDLIPADQDNPPPNDSGSFVVFFNLVTVDAEVIAPATLTGGTVTVEALGSEPFVPDALAQARQSVLPRNATRTNVGDFNDVDPNDNSDEFAVLVQKPAGNGGNNGGGGLPATGARAGLVATLGLGALVLGTVLVLLSRRRRSMPVGRLD